MTWRSTFGRPQGKGAAVAALGADAGAGGRGGARQILATRALVATARAGVPGRGLHSSTSQLNLSRV